MRKRKIQISVAVRKIRAHKPTSPGDFTKIGLKLRWLKSGVFRETCRIVNCNLVVKFPLGFPTSKRKRLVSRYFEGKRHTRMEVDRLKRLAKFPFMREYLPKVHYYDQGTGTLVMSYHPPFTDREEQIDAMGEFVETLILKSTGVRCSDLHSDNVHQKAENQKRVVLIDLGY
jgi:hypothetical protein